MLESVLQKWEERIRKEVRNDIAKKMLDADVAIEKIMQCTGLSREDILALKTENFKASMQNTPF